MVVANRRKGTLGSLVAKLLVLGDKQTGKSASIVRYTTGRFIEQYSESTSDWLYRHSLGFDAKRNVTTLVELIEQKDIQICDSSHFFASSVSNVSQIGHQQQHSLSSRVALDLQAHLEMHCKQQLLNKLHWANAYIVIYAINDKNSFNKAIKYLNLIANNINSPLDNKTACGNGASTSFCFNANSTSSNGFLNRFSPGALGGSTNLNTPTSRQCSPMSTGGSAGGNSNNCNCVAGGSGSNLGCNYSSSSMLSSPAVATSAHCNIKRPILLLGNKRDLEKSGRQVNAQDGRLLAMRHQSMFAEVSIAESDKLIEIVLANLIEQIDPACLQVEHLSPQQQEASLAGLQQIVRWSPTIELAEKHDPSPLPPAPISNSSAGGSPVWASLVKSQVPIGSAVIQNNRQQTADVRSIKKPVINSTLAASICQPVDRSAAKTITKTVAAPRRLISCSSELVGTPEVTHHQVANSSASSAIKGKLQTCHRLAVLTSNISAYQNLKTSFRRASMAIIGSKTLAKTAKPTTATSRVVMPKGQKYGCETIGSSYFANRAPFREKQCNLTRDSIGESSDLISSDRHRQSTLSLAQATTNSGGNWLRSHVRLGRVDRVVDNGSRSSCSDLKMMKPMTAAALDSDSERAPPTYQQQLKQQQPKQTDGQHTESRFKPLFKYKSRRKTVAFDQVVKGASLEGSLSTGSQTDSGLCNSLLPKTSSALFKYGSEDSTNSVTSTVTTTMPITSTSCNMSYDSTRCNSNRSSSSLSTMDAFYPNQGQFCDAAWNTEKAADSSSASVCSSNNSKEGGSARGCPSSGVRCVVTRSV